MDRELADHSAKLDILKSQHDAMANLPERMARIEEKLDLMSRMIYSILASLFILVCKEIWNAVKSIKSRLKVDLSAGESG